VASETEPLDQLIDQFESAQLLPTSIEPIETALARTALFHEEYIEDSIHSIIEIGWDHSWAIITLGKTPVYTRKIELGCSRIRRQLIDDHAMPIHAINNLLSPQNDSHCLDCKVERILSTLLTPMLTKIVDQLDTALTYVSQQHRMSPFGVVFRSGYFANIDQSAHAVAQRTGMPTIALSKNHYQQHDINSDISTFEYKLSPRLNIAAGLALGAA
jgi:Tfp pilus assembly PilM family ATPase